ncbi:hypothetical protein [Flavobacterium notoginsengisoli]|uniref:hypothetical protein n=1 Tax=Flavobacterium notoginsengisoli TaxID=1478199 RepID=UPI00363523CF
MNTENVLDQPKEETNYFYHFNFSKFKAITFPLAIIAVLFVIKQLIINNFSVSSAGGAGLSGMLISFRGPQNLPLWANILNTIINALILIIALCWEAVNEKKFDKIKYLLLLCLPAILSDIISTFTDLHESYDNSFFYIIYFTLGYLYPYALYGALRGKILYGKKINFLGYLIGMFTSINLDALYQKIVSILTFRDFYGSVSSYEIIFSKLFTILSFFYFILLLEAGFSFKNFIKMPATAFLNYKKFAIHFSLLFTSFLAVHFVFTEQFSVNWFSSLAPSISRTYYDIYTVIRVLFQLTFVYLLFSQLLLLQLGALRRRPFWIYLASFIPVINLIPLLFFFRKNTPLTDAEYLEIEQDENQRKLYFQAFLLFIISVYAFYKFIGLGLNRQDLICLTGIVIALYISIIYFRKGVWIGFAVLALGILFFFYQEIPSGFYYFCVFSYGAIGIYNLHIAIFWESPEWAEIEENIETVKTEEA